MAPQRRRRNVQTKVVRLKSYRPNNTNSTIIKTDLNPGYGKRALPVFSSPLSDLAVQGQLPRERRGNIYESTDSAQNNSTTSHHTHASLLRAFAESASGQPAADGGYPNFTTAEGDNALQALTSGIGNTGIGTFSMFSVTTGNNNTAVGAGALTSTLQTTIRPLALQRFCSTPPARTTRPMEQPRLNLTTPATSIRPMERSPCLLTRERRKQHGHRRICALQQHHRRWQHRVGRKRRRQSYHWRQ